LYFPSVSVPWTNVLQLSLSVTQIKKLNVERKIVTEKFQRHRASIDMLSKGPGEMQKNLPSSGGIKGSATITKLKNLMEEVETIKAER